MHFSDDGLRFGEGAGGFVGADLGDRIVGDQAELEHSVVGGAVFGGEQAWADLVQPYIKNYKLFTCPADAYASGHGSLDIAVAR